MPRVRNGGKFTFSGISKAPFAVFQLASGNCETLGFNEYILDLIGCMSHVVNNVVDCVAVLCINIGQQPVIADISLDSPGQSQTAVLFHKINKLGGRFGQSARCSLEHKLFVVGSLYSSLFSTDWNLEDVDGSMQSLHRAGVILCSFRLRLGDFAGIESVAE